MHDLHVQEAEKAAAEPEAERNRTLGLEVQGRIVQLQLLERVAQLRDLDALVGIQAAVDHRDDGLVALQRVGRGVTGLGDRVADIDIAERLDVGDHVADVTQFERFGLAHLRLEDADLGALVDLLLGHRHEAHARAQRAVDHADVRDDAAIRIELRVEDESAQIVVDALGRRNAVHDRFEDFLDADAFFGAGQDRVAGLDHQQLLDLFLDPLGIGGREIDLVDDRDDRQVVLERQVIVGQRLRFDALGRVDHEQRAFTGR